MTKKTLSKCAALLLCAALSFDAGAQTTSTDPVTDKQNTKSTTALNIIVDNAIEVVLNPAVSSVGFRLASAADFRQNVESTYTNAFDVTSNIPYSISFKTKDAEMVNKTQTVDKKIPVSAISVELVGTGAGLGTVAGKKALSSTTAQTLTTGAPETIKQSFSFKVQKSEAASTAFLVPGGLYSTDLYITATQD